MLEKAKDGEALDELRAKAAAQIAGGAVQRKKLKLDNGFEKAFMDV